MAGRGRGGGKPMSLNIDALGFGRGGEAMPTASLQPPPVFPKLEQHPLPLESSEEHKYLIDLKRYFQTFMEDSPYHVKRIELKKDIERYSDKYKVTSSAAADSDMLLYSRMPEELRPRKGKVRGKKKTKTSKEAIQNAIKALENKESDGGKAGSGDEAVGSDRDLSGDEEDEENPGAEEGAELDEEDMEEDNDYIQEYFDNGETFGDGDDDGLDDGPVY